jgi:hypothetical protein
MRKGWIYVTQIALSLVIMCGLAISCAVPSTPPASEYPADISGHVTIAEKVKHSTVIAVPPNSDSNIFWIVDISVKNNTYSDPVEASLETGYGGWRINTNDKVYYPRASDEELSIALGQTGQFVLYFEVPRSLQINDAQICYQGQEPYSYGELTGGDKVAAYDWYLKRVVEKTPEVAEYEEFRLDSWLISLDKFSRSGSNIDITLSITNQGRTPACFPTPNRSVDLFGGFSTFDFFIEDNYGIPYFRKDIESKPGYYSKDVYPNETVTIALQFTVNQKAENLDLYLSNWKEVKVFNLSQASR